MSPSPTMPELYTIAPGAPFVDALARGIIARHGAAPEDLARVRVLLPTRRACRALREAFLRLSEGRAMLLPVMTPLGDVDKDELALDDMDGAGVDAADLPPAVGGLARQVMLARYVRRMDPDTPPEQAVRLGLELARLVDQVHTEGLNLARLPDLVADETLSVHWQQTVRFLAIVGETWPAVLDDLGALDPARRRDRLLRARAQAWAERPPPGPVIAAGSTGTIPATAELLGVVARLPRGCVVLPGLDVTAPDHVWDRLDPTHPQYGMAGLLAKLGVARGDVAPWPESPTEDTPRRRLLDLALVPAEATDLWRDAASPGADASAGFTRIDAPGPREEAAAIALILREALETPKRTAALITPDRGLARRVAVEMRRWGVDVDDSAGRPLEQTAPGAFFHLVADMAAEDFHPVAVLACLKHPLAAAGLKPVELRQGVRALEVATLRGARPPGGLVGLEERLRVFLRDDRQRRRFEKLGFTDKAALTVLRRLRDLAQPLADQLHGDTPVSPATLVRAHADAAEALAAPRDGADDRRLWAGDAGEALSAFVAEAHDALTHFDDLRPVDYPALIKALMAGRPVRPRHPLHPRVHIWGLLEARLQRADVVVLGGLNEGAWPGEPDPSPWMSRPMMTAFGLPLPERRVGLAAHDFVQAANGTEVYITRAVRADGSPQVPSRWLTRLDTLMGDAAPAPDRVWTTWADRLTRPEAPAQACPPPRPTPPVAARPRRLSVTAVEKLIRDPYAIYAQRVLDLEPLDPIDADAGAADKGNVIHAVLERFVEQNRDHLPDDALAELLRIGEAVFREDIASPGVRAFWWPRLVRIAAWFADFERARRDAGLTPALIEGQGRIELDAPGGPFTLTAKADRLDLDAAGALAIVDYKTGAVPSDKEVKTGLAPQLPLEGLIALAGGFDGLNAPTAVRELTYVRLTGGRVPGEARVVKLDPSDAVEHARQGFMRLIHAYDRQDTPYLSRTRVKFQHRAGDFDHLARLKEWQSGDGEGDA